MGSRSGWRLGVPLVLVLAGLLLATGAETAAGRDLRADRRTELADLIRDRSTRVERAVGDVERLRAEVDELTARSGADDARVRAAREDAAALGFSAGMTALTGPGVTVTLADAPREPGAPLAEGVTPDDLVVHQQDVQAVVNAMWAGGAEGIQVMDQRLISTSAVRCVGNTLILGGRVYSPPYRITAVGPVAGMTRQLAASAELDVYRQWVSTVGLGYRVQAAGRTAVVAYEGPLTMEHAEVAP